MTLRSFLWPSIVLCGFAFVGCASTEPPTIFVPTQGGTVSSFYRNGLPIGAIHHEGSLIMLSMEPTEVADTKYMRLWFLYKNGTSDPFLLEPMKCVTLSIVGAEDFHREISPESPSRILANIENDKAANLIIQAIGGTLQSLSTKPTTVTSSKGDTWVAHDEAEKRLAINDRTSDQMSETAYLYNTFKESINSGILRRNTIFTGESVNGYIYFPLQSSSMYSEHSPFGIRERRIANSRETEYSIAVSAPWGVEQVRFAQEAGE
jgi:hypothetical protein